MTTLKNRIKRFVALPALAATILVSGIGFADETKAAPGENGTLGVALPLVEGPWYTALLYGIYQEADKLGYDVRLLDAGGYTRVDKQISNVSNLIVQQVKAILIDPINPASFNGVVKQSQMNGIPVLGVGSPIVASSREADGAASSSHCVVGNQLADGAKKLLPNGGTMAALKGPAGAPWSTERWRCFKLSIDKTNIKIVAEQNSDQDAANALSIANDFLQRFPNVDLIYGASATFGESAGRAVQQAGRCGKTKVLMAVLGEVGVELMKAGCADYIVAQQPVLIGRTAVQLADQVIRGQKPDPKLVEVPNIPVTKANLGSLDLSTIRQPKGWTP